MTKEDIRTVAIPGLIGLALMVSIGAAFRVFIGRQPDRGAAAPSPAPALSSAGGEPARSAEEPVAEPEPERLDPPAVCLARPIAEWTPSETNAYPQVFGWLEGQARRVLPWEWSNEALAKDPAGYCRLWRELCWELEARMLAEAAVCAWGTDGMVKRLAADAGLASVAELRHAYETEARLCVTDAPPAAGDLRRLEARSVEQLVKAIVRPGGRNP